MPAPSLTWPDNVARVITSSLRVWQIPANIRHKSLLILAPRERERRGMHPLIYASVEITEKAGEECRILLDVSSPPLAPTAGVSS